MKLHRHPNLLQIALFAVVGPPLGGLMVLLWEAIFGQPRLPFELWTWLIIMFPVAYVYFGAPAVVAGCVAALARWAAKEFDLDARVFQFALPVAAGAVASVLFSLLTIASEVDLRIAVVGALSALACTTISEWLLKLRPNSGARSLTC